MNNTELLEAINQSFTKVGMSTGAMRDVWCAHLMALIAEQYRRACADAPLVDAPPRFVEIGKITTVDICYESGNITLTVEVRGGLYAKEGKLPAFNLRDSLYARLLP